MSSSFSDRLAVLPQYLIPQHGLSRLVGSLADSRTPWIKDTFIRKFAARYQVDEIMVVTICFDFAKRKRSYELIAEAFGIGG